MRPPAWASMALVACCCCSDAPLPSSAAPTAGRVSAPQPLAALWFPASAVANLTDNDEAQALLFALAGLANSGAGHAAPALLIDTGALDLDFPASDEAWRDHLASAGAVSFATLPANDTLLCGLVGALAGAFDGATVFASDGFSLYPALTLAGLTRALPVSVALAAQHPCLAALPVRRDLRAHGWTSRLEAHQWAAANLLPNCSRTLAFNANRFPNAVPTQGALVSVDAAVARGAFVMDLSVLWACDPIDCGGDPPTRVATPGEAALFAEIVGSLDEGAAVLGWGDPEHAYTNVTSHAGGVVLCSFSAPNLAFWGRLGEHTGERPLALPRRDTGRTLGAPSTTYLVFETNEGDTPRILTSQFTAQWMSARRGSVPVSWAVDPLLAAMWPALWNFYAATAKANDTFVTGVDGAGYVFLHSLCGHAGAYERRAGALIASGVGSPVVDVGVADARWPAVTVDELETFVRNAKAGGAGPAALLNACGSDYGQPVNFWLSDGTPVFNSLCHGPSGDPDRHYLYYYRGTLNASDPAADLASRVRWAAAHRRPSENSPMFLLVFGGLGLYGGHGDFFTFLTRTLDLLGPGFEAVGAEEAARLAREVHRRRSSGEEIA